MNYVFLILSLKARKEEADRKRQEALDKKQERDRLIATEENAEKERLSKKKVGAAAVKSFLQIIPCNHQPC